jgi:hypothetical protein
MPLGIPEASPEHVVAVVDFAAMKEPIDARACAALADISEDHARRALEAAVLLGLLEPGSAGTYAMSGLTGRLLASGSRDQKRQIFRAHLEEFPPFAFVKTRLLQGFELHEACRQAKIALDLEPRPAVLRDLFDRWGRFSGSFVGEPLEIERSEGIDSPLARVIDRLTDDTAAAVELLSDELGPALYLALPEIVRDNLILGVKKLARGEEPRSVAQPLGIAFEDYLREVVATETGTDVAAKNGIIQVGDELRAKEGIAGKQLGFIHMIGHLRTAAEHGIDQRESEEWQITAKAVELLFSAVLSGIRSITAYVRDQRLEL